MTSQLSGSLVRDDHALESVLNAVSARLQAGPNARTKSDVSLWYGVALALLDGQIDEDLLARWFDIQADLPADVLAPLQRARASGLLTVNSIGTVFERWSAGESRAVTRRDQGVYFTPSGLAEFVTTRTLGPILETATCVEDVLQLKVCDPAAGAGAFAVTALELMAERASMLSRGSLPLSEARRLVLESCLYLIDADPLAVALLRSLLCAATADTAIDVDKVQAHVVAGDSVLGPPPTRDAQLVSVMEPAVDWCSRFPEVFRDQGFDVVIGNPPWGTVKPARREFFGALDPAVRDLQGAALEAHLAQTEARALGDWDAHSRQKRAYVKRLRTDGGYTHQGPGDTEFYRYFLERAHQLLRPGGRLGMLVPGAVQRAEGAAPLRRLLFDDGTVDVMLDFINTRRIFDIHSMFRFVVLVWEQGRRGGIQTLAAGLESLEAAAASVDGKRPVSISVDFLRRASGSRLSIPDVRDRGQADLFEYLHRNFPRLGERGSCNLWDVRFTREFDMTNDSACFLPSDRMQAEGAQRRTDGTWEHPDLGRLLPLYEGRMVHQFDVAAKRYLSGQGRAARWEPLLPGEKGIYPHYLVPEDTVRRRGVPRHARAAFCDVTGHANERTVLAALVPAVSVCGNKVPTCRFSHEDPRLSALWLALVNSFVIDWLVRRRASTTLNYFLWEQIPLPRLAPNAGFGAELVRLAELLSEPSGTAWRSDSLSERAELRASIDAVVADVFELDFEQVLMILNDFPLLDRSPGARRAGTATRDLFLNALALRRGVPDLRLSDVGLAPDDGGPNSIAERVERASMLSEIAYVPGELQTELSRRHMQ